MMRYQRVAILLAVGVCLVDGAAAQTIQINRDNKTIAISTTDEATALADIAAITIGFEVYGADSENTYADGGKISHAILEALHNAGVEDKSIESSGQGLQRNTDFDDKETPEQRAKKQFILRQSWEVNVSPQVAAEVLRVSIAAGANKSGVIDWRLSDRKSLQAKAAEAALVKARAVAGRMAGGLNVRLGVLIYASNETPNAKIYFARPQQGMVLNSMAGLSSSSVPVSLEIRPQTIREEATVYAVFAIE